MDEYLRPFVTSLPSHVKDTIQFLQILDSLYLLEHAILTMIDVEALYGLIPHSKGLAAVKHVTNVGSEGDSAYNEFILKKLYSP